MSDTTFDHIIIGGGTAGALLCNRLSADGRGEADPLTSNASETGRARNRRVELQLRAMP